MGGLRSGGFTPCSTVQSVSTETGIEYYQVKKGDTLWDISRKFNVDLQTIMVMNQVDRNAVLSVGQTLEIPSSRSRVYSIRTGDTLWDIASRYNTSVETLLAANSGKNPRNLKIGDKIVIPDSKSTLVASSSPSRSLSYNAGMFLWPVMGVITSGYGWRSSGFHHGIDIAQKVGSPIKAALAGKVTYTGYKPVYGNTVVIKHVDGRETTYAHAQKILVKTNQYVAGGQTIATVGLSGRTTGPHLHFEVKIDGKNVDPRKYLR